MPIYQNDQNDAYSSRLTLSQQPYGPGQGCPARVVTECECHCIRLANEAIVLSEDL